MGDSKTAAEPWQTCGILSCDMEAQCKQPDNCKSTGKSQTTARARVTAAFPSARVEKRGFSYFIMARYPNESGVCDRFLGRGGLNETLAWEDAARFSEMSGTTP